MQKTNIHITEEELALCAIVLSKLQRELNCDIYAIRRDNHGDFCVTEKGKIYINCTATMGDLIM